MRTPSRADDDIKLLLPYPRSSFVAGQPEFRLRESARLRNRLPQPALGRDLFDLAAYYNDYDELRTASWDPYRCRPRHFHREPYQATFGNEADAVAYGVELGASWNVTDHWTLSGWYTLMKVDVDLHADSTDVMTEATEDDTPTHQVHLRSRMNLPWNLEFDTLLFYVGDVPNQNTEEYTRLDLRLGWRPIESLELSVVGQNLVDRRHEEFGDGHFTIRSSVPRSVYGKTHLALLSTRSCFMTWHGSCGDWQRSSFSCDDGR